MKYAITYENHEVFQHFGKTPAFLMVEITGENVQSTIVATDGKGHGALSGFLKSHEVDTLVCGGIGQGARDALATANISILSGAKGNTEDVVKQLVEGTLKDDPSGMCHHHHEDADHDCGSHSCTK